MFARLLTATALSLVCSLGFAHDYSTAELKIDHPWSRELPPNAQAGGAYFVVHNLGKSADRLVGVHTPQAAKAEIHTMVQLGEVMKMQQLDSVGIPAEGEAIFAPGGNHIMLFGLKKPLVAGERFPLSLQFERAGTVQVEVQVEAGAVQAHTEH